MGTQGLTRKPGLGSRLSGLLSQRMPLGYLMNEYGGATLLDQSPNEFNGTFGATTQAPTWVNVGAPPLMGPCLLFTAASSQFITIANAAITTATAGSMAFWFRMPTQSNSMAIFGYGGAAHASSGLWAITINSSFFVRVQANTDGGGVNAVRGSTTILANTWYHVVITGDGSAWKIYINGQAETLTVVIGSNTGTWIGGITVTAPAKTILGDSYQNGAFNANYFGGNIDTFLVIDRVLSAQEARDLYVNQFAQMVQRYSRRGPS